MKETSLPIGEFPTLSVEFRKNIGDMLYSKLTIADMCRFLEIFEDEYSKLPYRELTFRRKLEALPSAIGLWKKDYDCRNKIRAIGAL